MIESYRFDDGLPPGQKAIITRSLEEFDFMINLLLRARMRGHCMMAVVTGGSGVGKSVAVQNYIDQLPLRSHTGLPACVKIDLKATSSPKPVMVSLYRSLGERPRQTNTRSQIADDAIEVILRNDLHLIFADEADLINEISFEFLRFISDQTRCPIVLIGLPQIRRLIQQHEKFAGRVGPGMVFHPPDEQEVLQTILPQLATAIPRWSFDASSESDLKVGREIWSRVRPSFRKLCHVLQIADILAETMDEERITIKTLRESYNTLAFQQHIVEEAENEKEEDTPPGHGDAEEESERRKDAKRQRKPKDSE